MEPKGFKELRLTFGKPAAIKPLGNVGLTPCLQTSPLPHQELKECYSMEGVGTLDILGTSGREMFPNPQVSHACLMASPSFGFWPGETTIRDSSKKSK